MEGDGEAAEDDGTLHQDLQRDHGGIAAAVLMDEKNGEQR